MLHFDSSKFLDDADESFVSIDLNDDNEECDICHQSTDEPIVHVVLSDKYLRFEGSCERYGTVTRAHQICLDKWSEIIERNLKSTKDTDNVSFNPKNQSPDFDRRKNINDKVRCSLEEKETLNEVRQDSPNSFETPSNKESSRITHQQLSSLSMQELQEMLSTLESRVKDASNDLILALQTRDQLHLEVSGQNSMIAQLVKLQNNPPKKFPPRCAQPKKQSTSTMTILV